MYLTVKETAQYLSFPENYIEALIVEGKIRAVHDGYQYLINREQFNNHLEQLEKHKKLMLDYLNEPIPEDIDIKDED
ncbi:excisionase family DNA-binding protein [Bacillus sp. 2205SS5-2]|uniref:excisionase family DNA-binding protein n=1 Tax=Bacillus sp. 2205SS5-2 TaxID=3109031 RepID=UPI0030076EB4